MIDERKNLIDRGILVESPSEHKTKAEDSLLFFKLFFLLIFYVLAFPFYSLYIILLFISGNFEKANDKFGFMVSRPFKVLQDISQWFFYAKYTISIIVLMCVVFVFQVFSPEFFVGLRTHPLDLLSFKVYTLITSVFMHANLIHLGSNMLTLLIFGRIVEKEFKWKFVLIFLVGGFLSNVVSHSISLYFGDLFYSIGASGAIATLVMLAVIMYPFEFTSVFILPIPIFVLGWALIFLDIVGLTNPSTINHFAHIGGYLVILVLLFFLEFKHRKKILSGFVVNLIMLTLFLVLLSKLKALLSFL